MSFFKRAYLQNIRKKGKTLLMFLLLLVMGTLILTCLSIQTATNTAALNVRESLMGSFTVDAKSAQGQLTQNVVDEILKIPGVKESYNGRSSNYAEFLSQDGENLEVLTEGAFQVVEGFEHAGRLLADRFSERNTLFTEKGFEIIDGEAITEGDTGTALVHEYFAEKNGLSIGDTITLSLNEQMLADDVMEKGGAGVNTVEVKIIGIFKNTMPQEDDMILSHMFYENIVFTDPASYSELYMGAGDISYEYGDFDTSDPAEIDKIIGEVQNIPGVDWNKCTFVPHDTDYQNAKKSLSALSNMVKTLVIIIMIVSIVLLILILALWVRSRVHETGVFLAMGFSKVSILLQHITEILMIAVCAFSVAFILSGAIAGTVGNHLLEQAPEPEYQLEHLTDSETDDEAEPTAITLTQIEIRVSVRELFKLYIVGSILIILSVAIATIPILRMKPKEILTKMN